MYPPNNIYSEYLKNAGRLPDYTKRFVLETLNWALNTGEDWQNFLDIGASTGHYSVPMLSKFRKGTAVEIDRHPELERLEKERKNFSAFYGNFNDFDSKEKFDFITMIDVFEHFPIDQIKMTVDKISSLQETGGVVYVLTPNPIVCGPAKASELFHEKDNRSYHGHYKHYLPNELEKIFATFGYCSIWVGYSESRHQSLLRQWIFGISRRDSRWIKIVPLYKFLSATFLWLVKSIFRILAWFLYLSERKNRLDETKGQNLIMIFKKQNV